jgi:hypothetical protein
MSVPPGWPQVLDFFGTAIVVEGSPGQLSGDAGLLPVRIDPGRSCVASGHRPLTSSLAARVLNNSG